MQKYLLILILLVIGMGLYADRVIGPGYDFGLLGADTYNLDLRYSNELRKLYVVAEFTIKGSELSNTSLHSFFMSRDAHLDQLYINGKQCGTILANNLVPEHFTPVLQYPELVDSLSTALCYTFNFNCIKLPESDINFKLVYWLQMPEWQKDTAGVEFTSLAADALWFPRNLAGGSTVNIELKTSARYTLQLDSECVYSEENGIRIHQGSFQDGPGLNPVMKIIKS